MSLTAKPFEAPAAVRASLPARGDRIYPSIVAAEVEAIEHAVVRRIPKNCGDARSDLRSRVEGGVIPHAEGPDRRVVLQKLAVGRSEAQATLAVIDGSRDGSSAGGLPGRFDCRGHRRREAASA